MTAPAGLPLGGLCLPLHSEGSSSQRRRRVGPVCTFNGEGLYLQCRRRFRGMCTCRESNFGSDVPRACIPKRDGIDSATAMSSPHAAEIQIQPPSLIDEDGF